jgi:hypothetical protein
VDCNDGGSTIDVLVAKNEWLNSNRSDVEEKVAAPRDVELHLKTVSGILCASGEYPTHQLFSGLETSFPKSPPDARRGMVILQGRH